MERVKKTLRKDYLTTKLYLEDLLSIEEILKSTKPRSFEVATEDYKFDSIEELKRKNQGQYIIKELHISINDPYISIDFRKYNINLYSGSDDEISTGIFYKLDNILSSNARKPAFLYSFIYLNIILWIFIPLDFLIKNSLYVTYSGLFRVILAVWLARVFYIRLWKSSDIHLKYKSEIPKFFQSNRDIFLVVVTLLGGYFLEHLSEIILILKGFFK